MLPPAHRMRQAADFEMAVRRGRRVRKGSLVVHLCHQRAATGAVDTAPRPVTVGLVVARSVGNSVVRHRVARRLRAIVAAQLHDLVPGTLLVIRALPAAAGSSSTALAADLSAALVRAG